MKGAIRPGFTLAELLVAMGLVAILLIALFSMLGSTLALWQRGKGRIKSLSTAQLILERVSSELQGLLIHEGTIQFIENSSLLTVSGISTDPATGLSIPEPVANVSENVFFVTRYPDNEPGDISVIAYRLVTTGKDSFPLYSLERAYVPSERAWAPIEPGAAATSTSALDFNCTHRYRISGYTSPGAGLLEWRPVVKNVVEFELQCFPEQSVINRDFGPPAASWNSEDPENPLTYGKYPALIRLRIVALDSSYTKQLREAEPDSVHYQSILTRHTREYCADIAISDR